MASDIRMALRLLRNEPMFAAASILTLALSIGPTLAVFTLFNTVLLRPLPFADPERLVVLFENHPETGQQQAGVLPGSYLDWRERSQSIEAIALMWASPFLITDRQESTRVMGATVSPNFFELTGVKPLIGRTFPPTEETIIGHEREIVISYGAWQRWFGADPTALGRSVVIQGRVAVTIVGVMPPSFAFPREVEFWRPEVWNRAMGRGETDRWRHVIARLKSGTSIDTARRELESISARLAEEFPETNSGWTVTVEPLADALTAQIRPQLRVMLGAAVLVFLIACLNLATLVLQRSLIRSREFATRLALGASLTRVARQSLVEHAVLTTTGTTLGVVLALAIVKQLVAISPSAIPRLAEVSVDLRVAVWLVLVALTAVATTCLWPALRTMGTDPRLALNGGAGRVTTFGGRSLVIAEVALAVILLASTGLMFRTMLNLRRVEVGFDPSNVIAAEVSVPTGRIMRAPSMRPAWDQLVTIYDTILQQVESLPSITQTALVAAPSLAGRDATWLARTGIMPSQADGSPDWRPIQHRSVTIGYFDVLRIPLLRGRHFSEQDHAIEFLRTGTGRRRGAAIVNVAAARLFWPGDDAVAKSLTIAGDSRVDGRVVIAVAGDARDLAPEIEPKPTVYVPFAQSPDPAATLLARLSQPQGKPTVAEIRARVRATESSLVVSDVRPLVDSYFRTMAQRRLISILLAVFSSMGLLLAVVGLYGLIGTSVAGRSREFAIRTALGASHRQLHLLVFGDAAVVLGAGMAVGILAWGAVSGLLRTEVFGVDSLDRWTWAAIGTVVVAAGVLAALGPARRASTVDPVAALRLE